jgi:hypothetical protein
MIERDWSAWVDAELERMHAGSWSAVDLQAVLDDDEPETPPTILQRSDGVGLIYPGKLHSLSGETESLKTWVALAACADRVNAGEAVLYIDFEDSARVVVERLRLLGVTDGAISALVAYIRPDEPLTEDAAARITEMLYERPYSLVVLDGLTEALSLQGLNPNDNKDVALWVAMLPRRIQRTGAAPMSIDHVAKNSTGRFAIGAQHKLAGLDGAAYTVEVLAQGGRGQPSTARLKISKDRPGFVRASSTGGKVAGEVHLRSTAEGLVTVTVEPSTTFTTDELGLSPAERRVLDAMEPINHPMYTREIGDRVVEMGWTAGLRREVIQRALSELARRGLADSADHRWWAS